MVVAILGFAAIVSGFVVLRLAPPASAEDAPFAVAIALFVLGGLFLLLGCLALLIGWLWSKRGRTNAKPYRLIVDSRGIQYQPADDPKSSKALEATWRQMTKAQEDQDSFRLHARFLQLYVPKRLFDNEVAMDAFRSLLRSRMGAFHNWTDKTAPAAPAPARGGMGPRAYR